MDGDDRRDTMMEHNAQTVQEIYEAFGRGDVASILERFQDDISWDEGIRDTGLAYLQAGTGLDHVGRFFAELGSTLRFDVFEPVAMCAGADHVMVAVREKAENLHTGGTIDENISAHLWTFGPGGKVASFLHIGDFALHERAAARQEAPATA